MRTHVTTTSEDRSPRFVTPPENTTLKSYLERHGKVVEEAYINFRPKAVSYARRKGNPNPEDFAHDTFLRALKVHQRIGENLEGVLHRRMVWDQHSYYRTESRNPIVRSILSKDEDETEDCAIGDIEHREIRSSIQTALQTLTPTDRFIIVLRYWEELSAEEIAIQLGLTNQAVRSRLLRSWRRMQIVLKEFGYGN